MSVQLVFETHSITVDNEAGIATGRSDGQLSEHSRALAAQLGERRRNDGVHAVFASDLGRVVETVEIAFGGSGIAIHLDARLRECNYGQWNGMRVARLAAERRRRICLPFPGGESYREVVGRVAGFLEDPAAGLGQAPRGGRGPLRHALGIGPPARRCAARGVSRRAVPAARRLALRASRPLAADLWGELRSPDAW